MNIGLALKKTLSLETNSQHSDYITSLRGISALSVIMLHVFYIGYGLKLGPEFNLGQHSIPYISYLHMGAHFFLLLSAYSLCISSVKKSSIHIPSFYTRRFFRIAPLFYFMTLVYVLWDTTHSRNVPLTSVLGNVFFIFNFMPQHGYFRGIIGASWFMSVIMLFYLVFPLIFKLLRKVSHVLWLFIISLIVSYAFRLSLHWLQVHGMEHQLNMYPGDIEFYGVFSLISNFPYFVMGIITYHISNMLGNLEKHKILGTMLLILTMIAFIGLPNLGDQYLINPIPLRYIIALLFIPLTLSLAMNRNRLFVNRFTVFMGKISYSLYLVHVFVILRIIPLYSKIYSALQSDWLAFICCYALTVSIAALISVFTHKLIEQPGAKLGDFLNKGLRGLSPSTPM